MGEYLGRMHYILQGDYLGGMPYILQGEYCTDLG